MISLFRHDTNFGFIANRRAAYLVSAALLLAADTR